MRKWAINIIITAKAVKVIVLLFTFFVVIAFGSFDTGEMDENG